MTRAWRNTWLWIAGGALVAALVLAALLWNLPVLDALAARYAVL